ncbi:MAG: hypothetical protein KKF50_02250 [Nanoarchaeota archaeon]|nr:hypothetical protein [Nanoarchaeota archaeon]
MTKVHWTQWVGAIPFLFLIGLLIFGYLITGFTIILNLIFVAILLLIYVSTYLFANNFFDFAEAGLSNDIELLKLEKENSAILWAFSNGIGIAFLISGLQVASENPLMIIIGLGMLSVGNLVYELFYYPRYALLVKKRVIEIMEKNE